MKSELDRVFDVHWYGPYSEESLKTADKSNLVLYAVYSTHPLYGKALVYIGMTTQDLTLRIRQHVPWTSEERDEIQVYAAAIGAFRNWEHATKTESYFAPSDEIIKNIEALLIFAHQPAYNKVSKKSAIGAKHYRIFNTGNFGALLPEISGLYYLGD